MFVSKDDPATERRIRMMQYVLRDEETDEITGLAPDAPDDVRAEYERFMEEEYNSLEPVTR